jgi:malate dehydrogenase (oxaloacetate-decarboxylating)
MNNISNQNQIESLELHKKLIGKLRTSLTGEVNSDTLRKFYTPGVGYVSSQVSSGLISLNEVSWRKNLVAVISDGSAVLGLGDIGPEGAMPVMEGKAMLFKRFAGIDSVPIVLNVHTVEEIVNSIMAISPSFGGINLEDVSAPKCFEIEKLLIEKLNIPVMHDDQHGTAIVVLAGLINSLKVVNKNINEIKIVILGAGAAGFAVANLIHYYSKTNIVSVDSKGIISNTRNDLNNEKKILSGFNKDQISGSLQDALKGADVVIGLSKAGALNGSDIKLMNKDQIVFALANPTPEIMPQDALNAGAAVVATGRSDFPNQINNVLAFPGIFKGALSNNVTKITTEHKIKSAETLANLVVNVSPNQIVPDIFDERIVPEISKVIK